MSDDGHPIGYGVYWKTWITLLILTGIMIACEAMDMPRALTIVVLCIFMLVKATMIGGYFMHLRFEKRILSVTVVIGLLVVGAIMFGVMSVDGLHVNNLTPTP